MRIERVISLHREASRVKPSSDLAGAVAVIAVAPRGARAQLKDVFQAPNAVNEGIHKTFAQEIGAGRGDVFTPGSSLFIIGARSVPRGPARPAAVPAQVPAAATVCGTTSARATSAAIPRIGAGLADSCAGCHGRPRGSAGHGGNTYTRPDSRDARHLFGAGLQEMLADEITTELRADPRRRDRHRAQHAHDPDRRPDLVEGAELRPAHRAPQRPHRHVRRRPASTPICACVRSWRRVG